MSQKLTIRVRASNRDRPWPRWTVSLILPHPLAPLQPPLREPERLVAEEGHDDRHRDQDGEAPVDGAVEEVDVEEGGADPVRHDRRREEARGRAQERGQEGDRVEDAHEEREDPLEDLDHGVRLLDLQDERAEEEREAPQGEEADREEEEREGESPLERVHLEQEAAEEDREDEGDHRADERVGGDAGQDPEPPRRGEVEGLEGPG